jgi:hypothetical protein
MDLDSLALRGYGFSLRKVKGMGYWHVFVLSRATGFGLACHGGVWSVDAPGQQTAKTVRFDMLDQALLCLKNLCATENKAIQDELRRHVISGLC